MTLNLTHVFLFRNKVCQNHGAVCDRVITLKTEQVCWSLPLVCQPFQHTLPMDSDTLFCKAVERKRQLGMVVPLHN
ncbi:unnamed protein product [Sphagnum compactum]